ncbi:hypothetical protein NQ317_019881 [Molorchus minor]|uniref:Uncharacterized protein n=1 Tax=Molorchus minor TaxID=1323400 RepID=A0ABQ9JAN2_9CUCU|nr:hypothetical protein NQ317_019881 [Molorchus minor]
MFGYIGRTKEKRKKIQEENVKAKEKAKEEQKDRSLKGMRKGQPEPDVHLNKASEETQLEDDDREYYRQEVGEEPDKYLFSARNTGVKRKFEASYNKSKKAKFNEDDNGKRHKSVLNKKHDGYNDKFSMARKKSRVDMKTKGKRKGIDKTGSQKRDFRPIGGKADKPKFKNKKKGKVIDNVYENFYCE